MNRNIQIVIFLLISSLIFSQKKLRVGEKIPFTRVQLINQENKSTKIDLPNTKISSDRFVLVLFFNPDQPLKQLVEINQRIEQILNRFQNNACKGASEIEYITVCVEKDFDKWQSYISDGKLNKTKFTGKKTNYLANGGLEDDVVKTFGVDKFPSFFVVNPKGRLWLETDNTNMLEKAFINICKNNASYSTADIAGKLLIGEKILKPLTNLSVYLINHLHDTLKTAKTDNYGDFLFSKVDTTQNLSIQIEQNENVKSGPKVFLAKQTGQVISEIIKSKNGAYEYKLLKADIVTLSPLEDEEDITFKYKIFDAAGGKILTVNENIYYDLGKYSITYEAEIILDKVLVILEANPNTKLEIISHTDSRGDDAANLILSQKRSAAVLDYLIQKGVSAARLTAIGKGESEIINRCLNGIECSEKEHEYNRRTEFNFIKN